MRNKYRWSEISPPLTHHSSPAKIGSQHGELTVIGSPSRHFRRPHVVTRCSCGLYGIVLTEQLSDTFRCRCPTCQHNFRQLNPYLNASDTPPDGIIHSSAGARYGTCTVRGIDPKNDKTVLQCDCGTWLTTKSPKKGICPICRDYVYEPTEQRAKFPNWWPLNPKSLSTLDTLREIIEATNGE